MPDLPYYQTRELRATIAGLPARVITKPGFPGWDSVSPTADLLAEAPNAAPGLRAALFGCGHAAAAVGWARRLPQARITLLDTSAVALAMAERTLAANAVAGAKVFSGVSLLPELAGALDLVAIDLPQSRPLARRWLAEAHALLREGGQLLLAGPNELGIQSAIADAAALFGEAQLVTYRRRCRLARASRGASPQVPAWAAEPGIAPATWQENDIELAGRHHALASLPGVFAYDRLDDGTALLLRHLLDPAGLRVLDAGCGYGPLGLAAGLRGAAHVDLIDASIPAVAAARENLARLGVPGEALAGDALAPVADRRYDLILSNLPFHTGKQVSYDVAEAIIRHGRTLLARGGRMVIVVNQFVRHDRLLAELFAEVETLADDRRYRVLSANTVAKV
jgi:16S rRNA (guanine1207-N2)-methyltransferase